MFIDEMPWMDSGKSIFVSALENFWNGRAMSQRNIMLVATGSATSWMKDKKINYTLRVSMRSSRKSGQPGEFECAHKNVEYFLILYFPPKPLHLRSLSVL